jgi:hypothetical protein
VNRPVACATAGAAVILAVVLPFARAAADAYLRLSDGRVLEGIDVRRDGDVYLLELPGDTVVPVPASLVTEVGIGGAGAEPVPERASAPTGLTVAAPRVLAGADVAPSTPAEQLAVFGEPARFQPDVVQSSLGPSYWHPDPSQHNFAPSTWAKAPIDPEWTPTPAFDPSANVLAGSETKWQKSVVDSSWTPTDGFAK